VKKECQLIRQNLKEKKNTIEIVERVTAFGRIGKE